MSAAMLNIARASVLFTINLYMSLQNVPGNIVVSPLSAQSVLSLAYLGAKGETANEMRTALQLPNDTQLIKDEYFNLLNAIKSNENITFDIANKIYVDTMFPINPEFKEASKYFLAEAEEVNFRSDNEQARVTINEWVKQRTHQKINNMFPEGSLNESSMLLVNAMYFKGKWKRPFKAENSYPQPFFISSSQSKDVQMMHIKDKFNFGNNPELKMRFLELPYKGEQVSMVILLPHDIDGLPELEQNFRRLDIFDLLKQSTKVQVQVTLPKFKLESLINLNEDLQNMGTKLIFDKEMADFSGISPGVFIDTIVQKAVIKINEKGTEAAAATGITLQPKSSLRPIEFTADHPFLFLLVNKKYQTILFLGRLIEF